MDSQATSTTIGEDRDVLTHAEDVPESAFDLSGLPPVLLLSTHMSVEELQEAEDQLIAANAPLTYSVTEARLFIGKVTQKRRALLELRAQGLWTEETACNVDVRNGEPPRKKRRRSRVSETVVGQDGSATESEGRSVVDGEGDVGTLMNWDFGSHVKVVKLAWLTDCVRVGKLFHLDEYLVYEGRPTELATRSASQKPSRWSGTTPSLPIDTITQAPADSSTKTPTQEPTSQAISAMTNISTSSNPHRTYNTRRVTHLVHETTSEHDAGTSSDLPEPPAWMTDTRTHSYSCCRLTPSTSPNDAFIASLKAIRLARNLTADEIGVRAYSSAMAAIAAYPYTLTSPREILTLPGCDAKIATLFVEWRNSASGTVQAARAVETDPRLAVLNLFYNIWGVGPHTAREFHDVKGWRDLDDVVEFGWGELSRVQQIGVKYYDEFQLGIPRAEVEAIREVVHAHAQKVREPGGVRSCIVGGYRRGKAMSGDVDVVVSHTDEAATLNVVTDIVASLANEGWVTHELITSLQGTHRNQAPLPFKGTPSGHGLKGGFDTLDKSMVVWQDIHWNGAEEEDDDDVTNSNTTQHKTNTKNKNKNPNPHRRVDIIIAPWSKAGCAVMGWSGATTFQRDLRRWSTNVKGWKFDSSGVRDRRTGEVVDFEEMAGRGVSGTMEEAERKVFEGLGLVYREPWERCTG